MISDKSDLGESFRDEVIKNIFSFSAEKNSFELLEKKYGFLGKKLLIDELIQVGVMPEIFEHDSSEEKLWSKFSDIVLCKSLDCLGLKSEVLRTRGNSADVYSRAENYTLVSDAKCFRLSRTAKNQKDFKVKSLDDWRREDTYALLVAPLLQYPAGKSQIYSQAIAQNVTLLSYLHLQFLIEEGATNSLDELWNLPKTLQRNQDKDGLTYWKELELAICRITKRPLETLSSYKRKEFDKTKDLGIEGINYWNKKIFEFQKLSKEEAVKLLIKSQKIEQKIETIKKAAKIEDRSI